MRDFLARIAGRAVERPTPVIVAAVLLTLMGAVAALRLQADRSPDSLVNRGSGTYAATQTFYDQFGGEPVEILVRGDLRQLLMTDNVGRLLALEGCLSGKVPGGKVINGQPAPPACAAIAQLDPSAVVFGPATFLNQFAIQANRLLGQEAQATQIEARRAALRAAAQAKKNGLSASAQQQAALAAGQQVLTQLQQRLVKLAFQYGQTSVPRLNDPRYVASVICDNRLPQCTPKARLSGIVPSSDAALISVRLRPGLSDSQRSEAISLIRDAVAGPTFQLQKGAAFGTQPSYVVSGVPVVFEGLAQELSTQIFILLAAALAAMVITLAAVFRSPLRLLPLAIALGATGIVFGFLSLAGGSLTMASIAVLPVLIGLSVDYAIQFQARFLEAARAGSSPPRAAVEAAARGGPVIATAGLATVAGFAVLVLSPIPMVRGFALLLVLGIVIAFALALTVGLSALSLLSTRRLLDTPPGDSSPARVRLPRVRRPFRRSSRLGAAFVGPRAAVARAGASLHQTGTALSSWGRETGRRALAVSIAAPGRVLAIAALVAVVGWGVGTRIPVISDIRQLVPRDLPALQNVDQLEQATGISGLTYVTVTAPDLSDPAVISWMHDFEQRVLVRHGFGGKYPSCKSAQTQICPETSLPDFLYAGGQTAPSRQRIKASLRLLPQYVAQALVTTDPATGKPGNTGVITFGIKVMPFDQQKELIDDIRAQVNPPGTDNDPPPGVNAQVLGLPVLAADANSALSGSRYLVTIAGLLAVALVLIAAYRSAGRALVPLIPIVLATGWSSLVLWVARVPLNPMSATLGALVIAIATEFSVLLSARYHEERRRGGTMGEALRRAYARTGAAVLASGVTAIAGFAVLVFTDIRMLRDFGLVTVFDLGVALVGVLLVLPAALVWSEGGFEPLAALAARLRRRGRPAPADAS
jgi:hydrophobe/amphiphile efflux-3 (HAE3) family protein